MYYMQNDFLLLDFVVQNAIKKKSERELTTSILQNHQEHNVF